MAHTTFIRNGETACDEKGLSNLAIAFMALSGIVSQNDYLVEAQGTPDNTVKVNPGRIYVKTTDGTMMYGAYLDSSQNVAISPNVSGVTRTDSIVVYFDLSVAPNADASNVAKFYDVTGPTDGSQDPPTNAQILAAIGSTNPYFILANVSVANGFTSINNGNITDKRTLTALGGGGADVLEVQVFS